jgi:hypothetical protein
MIDLSQVSPTTVAYVVAVFIVLFLFLRSAFRAIKNAPQKAANESLSLAASEGKAEKSIQNEEESELTSELVDEEKVGKASKDAGTMISILIKYLRLNPIKKENLAEYQTAVKTIQILNSDRKKGIDDSQQRLLQYDADANQMLQKIALELGMISNVDINAIKSDDDAARSKILSITQEVRTKYNKMREIYENSEKILIPRAKDIIFKALSLLQKIEASMPQLSQAINAGQTAKALQQAQSIEIWEKEFMDLSNQRTGTTLQLLKMTQEAGKLLAEINNKIPEARLALAA